jgi:hypothetical protein
MSPEGLAHAMTKYIEMLEHQTETAKSFFLGLLAQGMEGLLALPEDVQLRIDQWLWDAAGGFAIDPTEKESQKLIAAAIMRSLEERMGMDDPIT